MTPAEFRPHAKMLWEHLAKNDAVSSELFFQFLNASECQDIIDKWLVDTAASAATDLKVPYQEALDILRETRPKAPMNPIDLDPLREHRLRLDGPALPTNAHEALAGRVHGDNFTVDVLSTVRAHIEAAILMCLAEHKNVVAVKAGPALLDFFWHEDQKNVSLLPFLVNLIEAWAQNARWPEEPDHDGSNGRCLHVTNNARSEDGDTVYRGYDYFAFRVEAAWMTYSK